MRTVIFALVVALAVAAVAQPSANKVTSLPGYSAPIPFDMYAGYITVNETLGRNLFYWFMEADGPNPQDVPVVVWLNGGPGCSSMDGNLYEHGPFHFVDNTTLYANPNSWNKVANMLYIDSPAGVGLSYTETESDYYGWTDDKVADDLFEFIVNWYKSYPAFADNDLYIAGESYAGHYVPTFANRVRLGNLAGAGVPLKGILVGNGVTDDYYDGQGFFPMVCNHALLSNTFCKDLAAACNGGIYWNVSMGSSSSSSSYSPSADSCIGMMEQAYELMGDYNIYDIYLPCVGGHTVETITAGGRTAPFDLKARYSARNYEPIVPCISSYDADGYLNQPAVREAIHAIPVSQQVWEICNLTINENYESGYATMTPFYYDFLAAGYRVLVYSGDVDTAVPITGTSAWVDSLGLEIDSPYQPWYLGHNVAGYSTHYSAGLTFTTVKGSGHMVPQFKPPQALEMFMLFLNNKPFNSTADHYYTSITYSKSTAD